MEVHHHPHVEKKGFKEYLLEGLMIFLAVSMGFIAENIREHFSDKAKEKEFISSLKEDLVSDTISLNHYIPSAITQYEKLDSLFDLLQLAVNQKPYSIHNLYYLNFKYAFGILAFHQNKRTISQLKNTGSYHLITGKASKDEITQYDNLNQFLDQLYIDLSEWTKNINYMSQKIFDYTYSKTFAFGGEAEIYKKDALPLHLLTTDKSILMEYSNKVRSLMMMSNNYINLEKQVLKENKKAIQIVNKEYHLEKE